MRATPFKPYAEACERSSISGSRHEFPYWVSGSVEAQFERPQVEPFAALSDEIRGILLRQLCG
jgi:hypothetical protein